VLLLFALLVVGVIGVAVYTAPKSAATATQTSASLVPRAASEPDEPCASDGDSASALAAAEQWCAGGVFIKTTVKASNGTMVATLQFSRKGFAAWQSNRGEIVHRFRGMVDEIVNKTDMNVGIALFGPDGTLAGGCTRHRGDVESLCR